MKPPTLLIATALLFSVRNLVAADAPAAPAGNMTAAASVITPAMQTAIDAQKTTIAAWAADPVIVAAVKAQNVKGPITGMDNAKWAALKVSDPIVVAFQQNPAAVLLAQKLKASNGLISEAFLNAAKGEKVAFVDKTTSYLHAGMPKFDVPMTGKPWQGTPMMDASSQVYSIQISTPVLDNGKPIGVLVVGLAENKLGAK